MPRKAAALLFGFVLILFVSADTPQGASSLSDACSADPPPAAASAAQWFPRDPQFALAAARELLARPDFPAALCYFRRVEFQDRNDSLFYLEMGDAAWGSGVQQEALRIWEYGLERDPESGELLGRLCDGYLETQQYEDAVRVLTLWIARQESDWEAHYRLGLIQAALDPESALNLLAGLPTDEDARALATAIRAAGIHKDPAYLYARTGEELLQLGEVELAQEALSRAIAENPEYGEAYSLLGLAKESAGEDPAQDYLLGVQYATDSALSCLLYGAWLQRQGEEALARWWLTQAWNLTPGNWTVANALAMIEFSSGDIAAAEDWLRQAVEANPEESDAWMAVAAFYIENDLRVEEYGIPAARQAVLLDPQNDRAVDLLGRGWLILGDFAAAERLFRSALEINPESPDTHLHLAMCLLETGRTEEARDALQSVIRLDPDGKAGAQASVLLEDLSGGGRDP